MTVNGSSVIPLEFKECWRPKTWKTRVIVVDISKFCEQSVFPFLKFHNPRSDLKRRTCFILENNFIRWFDPLRGWDKWGINEIPKIYNFPPLAPLGGGYCLSFLILKFYSKIWFLANKVYCNKKAWDNLVIWSGHWLGALHNSIESLKSYRADVEAHIENYNRHSSSIKSYISVYIEHIAHQWSPI